MLPRPCSAEPCACLLRPRGLEPSYLGPEIDLSLWHVNLGLGALFRLSGSSGGGVIFSWSLGARF